MVGPINRKSMKKFQAGVKGRLKNFFWHWTRSLFLAGAGRVAVMRCCLPLQ
jgi:hypothetical protein